MSEEIELSIGTICDGLVITITTGSLFLAGLTGNHNMGFLSGLGACAYYLFRITTGLRRAK